MALVVAAQDQQEEEEEEEEEEIPATGEERILSRVAANHLFLGQFEAFRGTLKTLAGKNLEAAVAMLRAVVAVGGRLPGFLVSRSVPSPAHLAWMCVLELEEFDRGLHSVANVGLIKELVELLLLLEQLESEVAAVRTREAESQERSEVDETGEECIVNEPESRVDVEAGFTRDIADFYLSKIEIQMNSSHNPVSFDRSVEQVVEKMQGWIEFVTVCQPDLMAALCRNIRRQKELGAVAEGSDLGLAIQQQVQRVHLNCIKYSLDQGVSKRNFRHLKYLDESYAVSESEYSDAVSILARSCRSQDGSRKLLASAYEGILSSGSTRLLSVLEDCQDTSIHTEERVHMPSDGEEAVSLPRPFWKLHERLDALRTQKLASNGDVITEFLQDVFHHARVKREHVLGNATETALTAVKALQHQVAADVLVPFPRLQPLVAAMGWDLLRGNTAARRSMMELLWYKRSTLGKDLPKHVEEVSCIENLCDQLCYNLELAYFVADLKSGVVRKFDSPGLLTAGSEDPAPSDLFAANLVLERLAEESPLRVMFDMIPNLELEDAVTVLNLQPVSSSLDLSQRDHDLELLHMRYALQAAVTTVIAIQHNNGRASSDFVTTLQNHFKVIKSPVRRIWMLAITVSLLQMEEGALQPMQIQPWMQETMLKASGESEDQPVMNFLRRILELIRHYLPSAGFNIERHRNLEAWKEAWESERIRIGRFIEDWSWRLRVLERLILRPGEQLSWKSALTVLHCEPGTLLNMCIQQGQYDLAKDAVNRFALPSESAAILQLTEWLHNTVMKGKVISLEDLKGFIFAKYLPPLSSVVLCLDVAATYAPSYETSKLLLEQARATLSQTSQEVAQKKGAEHLLPVVKRILQRFHDLLEQWQSQPLPAILSSADPFAGSESLRQGPKQRALIMLHQIIDDAHNGKGQFLSGKLHNLVKALADEELDDPSSRLGIEKKQHEQGVAVGLGFRASLTAGAGTSSPAKEEPTQQIQKPTGKRFWGPLVNKPTAYLSAFILYIATIGDIVDGVDTTHDFNFFSLLYERPGDLLTRLVFERGSTDSAAKVAEIMGADLVHQVISACVPPVFPPRASSTNTSTDSNISSVHRPEYQLDLDTIKYLTSLSPVRSILACVFGSKESKIGHDYAVEQAERFPTLQRWIQMQANLQRLRDSAIFPAKPAISGENKRTGRAKLKRRRDTEEEEESKCESPKQIQENEGSSASTTNVSTVQVWEDEYPYEEAVEGLIKDGKLVDALAFADRWLKDGAPDKLLQLLIERGEDTVPSSSNWQGLGGHHNLWNSSWQYCIRLKDKRLAATLALKYLHRWELDAAIDVLTMCSCHLPSDDVLCEEVLRVKKHLQQYRQILREDALLQNWQDIESWCERDPEGLALRLAGKGAVTAALDIAESFKLSDDLRRELQGRQLVKLLTADPINGGGPAEALRFLGSLNRPEDALPVAMAAMEQLPNLHSKQLLVHFLLKRQIGFLSEEEHTRMDKLALGLKMLGALPLPWQQRCAGLHEHPVLILETLLMWKQFQAASQLLEAFPSLRNDKLIITYASKAIHVTGTTSGHQAASKIGSSNKLNVSNGTNRRGVFSWTSRDTRNKIIPKDGGRKRKSTLPPSQKAAWEAMAGYQEDRPIGLGPEGYEKLAPLTMADEWVLSGDPVKDESVRGSHKYESAPSFVLFKALLSLCFDQAGAAKSAVELAVSQVKTILSAECLPIDASSEAIERAFHAAGTLVQVLLDARTQLHKLLGNIEASSYSTEEPADASKNSSGENLSLNSLTKLLTEADVWLNRVELLHSLLGSGVTASVEDVADEKSALLLRDRLIQEERYGMALYTCTKCKIDVFPVWEAWGYALLRIEHYAQARLKFKKALQLYKDDPSKVVQEIVKTMEACPPADVPATRSLYMHMAKSVSSASDDSLSADSYLNVLYIPTFTRAERSRRSIEAATERLTHFSADEIAGPLSNLDTTRYEECRYYMDEYARPLLLQFMFRHGRYGEACSLFFPLGTVPPAPAALSSGSSKLDSLATEYGCIEELSEHCVAYGAIPILERTIEARMSSNEDAQVSQHTSAALTRICNYLEHQRHFNHLYRFQVLKKDYIAAGLCCVQLFINSSTQDQALRHLERAKAHFEEGLLARQQVIENVKSGGKASRGKSPSEKLTDEDLIKFSARVTLQMEVLRCFNDADVEPWKRSLFGNPNDTDTFKRRCEIAEALVEKNFDLAFQIIYDFGLPAVYIYAGVAALLAEKRKYNNLVELLRNRNIRGTIDNEDLDQIIGAAISVYANKHRERPDRLIDMLSSNHRKVLACVICGRLKSAFQIASRSGNVADVQWVAQQARLTGALPVEDMCKQWLARAS